MILKEDENNIWVHCKRIDRIHFTYDCPFCWKLRNGRIVDSPFNQTTKRLYMSAKPNQHYHGSDNDFRNREEHRISHCTINHEKGVYIVIDDDTIKQK